MVDRLREVNSANYDGHIRSKLEEASRRIRLLRATAGAVRATLIANCVLIPLIVFKQVLPVHPAWSLLFILVFAAVGALHGLLLPLSVMDVARLLDTRLALKERLQSALEFLDSRGIPVVGALIENAAMEARRIDVAQAFPLGVPRGVRYLPPAFVLSAALLFWLPAIPILHPAETSTPSASTTTQPAPSAKHDQESLQGLPNGENLPKHDVLEEKGGPAVHRQPLGDLKATFKDTLFSARPPDFASFLKGGDDRLSLLDPSTALPELQRDATQTPYQVSVREREARQLELEADQISREEADEQMEELKNLFEHQEAPQHHDAGKGSSTSEGPRNQEGPQWVKSSEGTESPKNATERLSQNDKRYSGGQESHDSPGASLPPWLDGPEDPHVQDAGTGEGETEARSKTSSGPGKGHSKKTKGPETPRITTRREQDFRLSGQPGEGEQISYDTDLLAPGAKVPSRVPYQDQFIRYERMAEEMLTKDRVPFEYREDVKRYFSAVGRRR